MIYRLSDKKVWILFFAVTLILSCSGNKNGDDNRQEKSTVASVPLHIDQETTLMLEDLKENGDYVNSREFPSLIKASVVYESLADNIHIIDIRTPESFANAHIEGAVNIMFEDIPEYFETGIKPFEYEKIILVDDDGQLSSYTTSLLRLMGYGNVYAMRWGMSSWNRMFAETGWLQGISSEYESFIEHSENEKPVATNMPELNTGLTSGADITAARFSAVFSEGIDHVQITAKEVFADPQQYFIINYERKDRYEDGHIPGAIRYKQGVTLSFVDEMATIPVDKTIVVYCGTGHNSGFVTAYLRLFGYESYTLKYGNNSFMYDKMVKDEAQVSWLPFSEADINAYPFVQ